MSANLMSLARSGGKFLKLFGDRTMVKTMPTARDYVQDGLIAMWDGIENAGWGVHDPNATVWKNLISGQLDEYLLLRECSFVEDGLLLADEHLSCAYGSIVKTYNEISIEICCKNNPPPVKQCDLGTIDLSPGTGVVMFSNVLGKGIAANWWLKGTSYEDFIVSKIGEKSQASLTLESSVYTSRYNGVVCGTKEITNPNIEGFVSIGALRNQVTDRLVWNGTIHRFAIYNRSLTAGELDTNYAIDKARFNLTTPTI